jgi:hypothetical protein
MRVSYILFSLAREHEGGLFLRMLYNCQGMLCLFFKCVCCILFVGYCNIVRGFCELLLTNLVVTPNTPTARGLPAQIWWQLAERCGPPGKIESSPVEGEALAAQISVMELGHLLTRSGLTHAEVSSRVCHDSFCQLGNSVSLPWVIYYEAFYLHVVSSFSDIPVIFIKMMLFLIPLQFVHLFCTRNQWNVTFCFLFQTFFSALSSLRQLLFLT